MYALTRSKMCVYVYSCLKHRKLLFHINYRCQWKWQWIRRIQRIHFTIISVAIAAVPDAVWFWSAIAITIHTHAHTHRHCFCPPPGVHLWFIHIKRNHYSLCWSQIFKLVNINGKEMNASRARNFHPKAVGEKREDIQLVMSWYPSDEIWLPPRKSLSISLFWCFARFCFLPFSMRCC